MSGADFSDFPVPVSRETVDKFIIYQKLVEKWQEAVNLVAPGTLKEFISRHLINSAQISRYLPDKSLTLFDFGSGAGFPGLVLAMIRPDITTYLIESDEKKSVFLKTVSRETKTPVTVLTHRIKSLGSAALPTPDIITARALAPLAELLGLALPWAEQNRALVMLFPKGERAGEEIAAAREKYDFRLTTHPSLTDPKAAILEIAGVCTKGRGQSLFS